MLLCARACVLPTVHLVLYQGVCGNEQTLEQVARELEMQVDDAGSALRQGIFTSKATAVCVTDILLDSGVQELADADSTLTTDTLDAARLQPYANSPLKIGSFLWRASSRKTLVAPTCCFSVEHEYSVCSWVLSSKL